MVELAKVKRACKINDLVFNEIVKNFSFDTEKDLEKYILKRFKHFGAGYSYDSIVANNTSVIHAIPRKKKFERGFVVLDFGSRVDGWCSDMTRTIFLGEANIYEKKLYNLVLNCQKKCVRRLKIGASYKEIDGYARKLLGRYRKYFLHGLGHGVGWRVHSRPKIGPKSEDFVKLGDIIAIEPGIYFSSKGNETGIRVEDTIHVGRKVEVLSRAPKGLIEIKSTRFE